MLSTLQDLYVNDAKSIDKVIKVLSIWLEKDIFDKQTVSQWKKTFAKLRDSASEVSDSTSGVAIVSDLSNHSNAKKRSRSPPVGGADSTSQQHLKKVFQKVDEFAEALKVQTIQFLSRIFQCLHDQYEMTLRDAGRTAAMDEHTSLNVVMFSSFYLLQHYLYAYDKLEKYYDPVALAVACIFISGKVRE